MNFAPPGGLTLQRRLGDALCVAESAMSASLRRSEVRDSGASSIIDPEAPTYTLRDLAADAAALARELDDRPAH